MMRPQLFLFLRVRKTQKEKHNIRIQKKINSLKHLERKKLQKKKKTHTHTHKDYNLFP